MSVLLALAIVFPSTRVVIVGLEGAAIGHHHQITVMCRCRQLNASTVTGMPRVKRASINGHSSEFARYGPGPNGLDR